MIKRLLVASRGEIAIRIMATAAVLGIETVAVHPADDAASAHVSRADVEVELPGAVPQRWRLYTGKSPGKGAIAGVRSAERRPDPAPIYDQPSSNALVLVVGRIGGSFAHWVAGRGPPLAAARKEN